MTYDGYSTLRGIRYPIAETEDAALAQAIERACERIAKFYGDDWYTRIDLDRLDLASGQYCILGQLEMQRPRAPREPGDAYGRGEARMGWRDTVRIDGDEDGKQHYTERATLYGVNMGSLPYDGLDENGEQHVTFVNYGDLDEAWKQKIRSLLASGGKEV